MPLTPTLIQSQKGSVIPGTSVPITLNGTTAGNTLLACAMSVSAGTISYSDGTNTWVIDNSNSGGGFVCKTGRASNIAGGNVTVTASCTASGNFRFLLQEWSNVLGASPLDQVAVGQGSGTVNVTTGATGTLSQSGELVVCYAFSNAGSPSTWTLGSGFTQDPNLPLASVGTVAEYLVASGTGAQTGTWTLAVSTTWITQLSTYLPASAPSTNIQLLNRRYVQFYT
jgi:hypothetical protein